MQAIHVSSWVRKHPLTPIHIDCATAVMLKILDGKCKMGDEEKVVMAMLYEAVKHQTGELLGEDIHQLIAQVQHPLTDEMKMFIYEKRLLAETAISRPIMKGFKAMIREQGLFRPGKVVVEA
jgi:hypothetical protein